MFAVFGVTDQVVAEARKKMLLYRVSAKIGGKTMTVKPTDQQWKAEYERLFVELKDALKPKQLSNKLDTPDLARQYLRMTKQQVWSRDLQIKVHAPVLNGLGKPVRTPKGTVKKKWTPLAEFEQQNRVPASDQQMDWVA